MVLPKKQLKQAHKKPAAEPVVAPKTRKRKQQQAKKPPAKKSKMDVQKPNTYESRQIISKYINDYIKVSKLRQPKLAFMTQPATYESQKMCVAFEVAVKNHLGNRLRGAINILCQSAIRSKALRIALKAEGASEDDIDWAIQERIKDPIKLVKEQVASGGIVPDVLDADTYSCDGRVFKGSIQTDGVSICIIKRLLDDNRNDDDDDDDDNGNGTENPDSSNTGSTTKGKGRGKGRKSEFKYITQIKMQLSDSGIKDNYVLIDPGRRDLLYCMHKLSTADKPWVFRYTRNMKDKWTHYSRHRKIRERARANYKDGIVLQLEQQLAKASNTTLDPAEFDMFLAVQSEVWDELDHFYSNTMTTYDANPKPLHRQLRLASYLNGKHTDDLLCNKLRQVFGKDVVLIIGNWSAPMSCYHEPTKGVGMLRMLRDHGFQVLLVDEFRTSSICPYCETDRLQNPKQLVSNPRCWQRRRNPRTARHDKYLRPKITAKRRSRDT
ncbi:hypothetical protein IW138_001684 [Coemansia sp. RSA 986]|nr:hypothetical protein IW138_001684 [Coemansia sp. RSA 986]